MDNTTPSLDNVRVASPCHARWEEMTGSESVRFCAECRLNVYNLSAMTRPEAQALVDGAEGRLCIRYYQRADGTILTHDCPIGVRTVRQRLALWTRSVAAAALALVGCRSETPTVVAGNMARVSLPSHALMGDTVMTSLSDTLTEPHHTQSHEGRSKDSSRSARGAKPRSRSTIR